MKYPDRKLVIFLPRHYGRSNRRCRVLYMNDGNTAFFKSSLSNQSFEVAKILKTFCMERGDIDLMVVAIYPVNRNHEYTHARWHGDDCCGLESYTEFVADYVVPFIDRHYDVMGGPENTMILGASHGGLASFYMATRRSDRFGFAGVLSPSFWVGVDDASGFPVVLPIPGKKLASSFLIECLQQFMRGALQHPRIFMSWGLVRREGPHNQFIEERAAARGREMVELLCSEYDYKIGYDMIVYEDPAGEHSEGSWKRQAARAILYFLDFERLFDFGHADHQ